MGLSSDMTGIGTGAQRTAGAPDVLATLRGAQRESLDRLVPLVYRELRLIAHHRLAARGDAGADASLATTALVHESYLKLVDQSRAGWNDRAHFLALASVAMRHVLIDHARARVASRRGGDGGVPPQRVTLADDFVAPEAQPEALLDLDEALTRLAEVAPRLARVVECRFFGGLSEAEIAAALGVTARTVERDWVKARMLLRRLLAEEREL